MLDDRLGEAGLARFGFRIGQVAGQELVGQHAERVDIGGRRDRLAEHLLGRGVFARHHRRLRAGEPGLGSGFEQLGDAEIEQLHGAFVGDQDVGRLEIAMDDEIAVRVGDRRTDLQQQREPRAHVEPARVAPARDRRAGDVFEREIRRAVVRDAAVVQLRDVRMHEPREDFALAQEAKTRLGAGEIAADALERHALREIAAFPLGEEHLAHAAFAEELEQLVDADAPSGEILGFDVVEQPVEQAAAVAREDRRRTRLRAEQRLDFLAQRNVPAACRGEPCGTLAVGQVLTLQEQRLDLVPARHQRLAETDIERCRLARASSQSRRTVRS